MADGERHSRQVRFAGIGPEGQERIRRSSVALVGCGALGSVQAELLTRAGVGRIRIIDRDFVEISNLQRQLLFTEEDALQAIPKAVAAARRLRAIDPAVAVEPVVEDLVAGNAESLLAGAEVILDGTDNFEVRYLINDVAWKTGRPWIYGACVGSYGLSLPVLPPETACLRCLVPAPPAPGSTPGCDTAGVLGPVAAAVGSRQAAEALKILAGRRERVRRTLQALDLWHGTHQEIGVAADPGCPVCAGGRYDYLEGRRGGGAARLCGRNAVQISPGRAAAVDLERLAARLGSVGEVLRNAYLLRVSIGELQLTVFRDGRAIVTGTEDAAAARAAYARYVGA